MRHGVLYGVGVGPGDPELITVKAVKTIEKTNIIAFPGENPQKSTAFMIAVQAVPQIEKKSLLALPMPMIRDRDSLSERHIKNAEKIIEKLAAGEDVAFLTLGDPDIYSTFSYIRQIVAKKSYEVQTISGVTSFCAAAARLGVSLADWDETVHIIPTGQRDEYDLSQPGTYVFMKPRGGAAELKERLKSAGRRAFAVTRCGMDGEAVYMDLDDIPDEAEYFTLIISK